MGYNLIGQQTSQRDGNGYRMGYRYDELDRLLQVTQYGVTQYPGTARVDLVTEYGYDKNGNRTTVTDARGQVARFYYDGLDRMWRQKDGRGVVTREFRFDDAGNVSQKVEPRNGFSSTTVYAYDLAHRLTGITYQRSPGSFDHLAQNVAYAYDGLGRRVYMWDGFGASFYSYDVMGRLQEQRGLQQVVSYEYDRIGNLTAMTSHLGRTTYEYDAGYRVTKVTDPLANQTTYAYDPNYGYLATLSVPLASPTKLIRENHYYRLSDGRATNRLNQIHYQRTTTSGSTHGVWQGDYTYDLVGMVRTHQDTNLYNQSSPTTQTYTYDEAYRLLRADNASGINNHPNNYYAYDNVGNRTTWGNELESGTIYDYDQNGRRWQRTATFDDGNRMTSVHHYASSSDHYYANYYYENNGNLVRDVSERDYGTSCGSIDGGGRTSFFDDANRFSEFREVSNYGWNISSTTFKYDGDGNKLSEDYRYFEIYIYSPMPCQTLAYDHTQFEYANGKVLNERNAGGVPVWYIRDPKGELLYTLHWRNNQLQPDGYVRDHLGSIRKIVDLNGYVANESKFDPYGNLTASSTSLRNSYLFTGYAKSGNLKMYDAQARYYNPGLGRFLTQDTYLGNPWQPWTLNLYSYVGNNPINFTDPTGHMACEGAINCGGDGTSSVQPEPSPPHTEKIQAAGLCSFAHGDDDATFLKAIQAVCQGFATALTETTDGQLVGGPVPIFFSGGPSGGGGEGGSLDDGARSARHHQYVRKYGTRAVVTLSDGRIRYYGEIVEPRKSGRTIGTSYVHEWDPSTGGTRGWMESYNSNGDVIQVHSKQINGKPVDLPHYMFDDLGNFKGEW